MCPACLTTSALLAAGLTSSGGLLTLVTARLARSRSSRAELPGPDVVEMLRSDR